MKKQKETKEYKELKERVEKNTLLIRILYGAIIVCFLWWVICLLIDRLYLFMVLK